MMVKIFGLAVSRGTKAGLVWGNAEGLPSATHPYSWKNKKINLRKVQKNSNFFGNQRWSGIVLETKYFRR
jgi:hypothetical protein